MEVNTYARRYLLSRATMRRVCTLCKREVDYRYCQRMHADLNVCTNCAAAITRIVKEGWILA